MCDIGWFANDARQDLCNIGRLLGLEYFETNAEKLDEHRRAFDRAQKKESNLRKEGAGDVTIARAVVKGKTVEDQEREIQDVIKSFMATIRIGYDGAVIRRTINSKDWRGSPISGLEPYDEHLIILKLSDEEQECQCALAEAVEEEGAAMGGKKLNVSVFICLQDAVDRAGGSVAPCGGADSHAVIGGEDVHHGDRGCLGEARSPAHVSRAVVAVPVSEGRASRRLRLAPSSSDTAEPSRRASQTQRVARTIMCCICSALSAKVSSAAI